MDQWKVDAVDQTKTAAVVERVRRLIQDGALVLDDRLPSTRQLAQELGVARGTVVAAYEQLDGEGWIRTAQGAPARVATSARLDPARMPAVPVGRPRTPGARRLDLRPGIPDVAAISARDRRAAWRAALAEPLRNALAHPAGAPALREQVAAQLALVRGFAPAADRVVVCGGTSDALSVATEALRRLHGRAPVVAVEDPGYPAARAAITSAGGVLRPVRVDEAGLDPDLLPADVDAVLVTPAHQYPLGAVMPVERRRRLLARAAAIGAVVLEDDYDSEFRHRGAPLPALAALDADGVVVHLGTFSKNLDPALRCSTLVLPPGGPVAEAVRAARAARGPVVADTVQLAVAHLIRSGALRRHVGRLRRDYTHKRSRIAARLGELEAHGLRAHGLHGGLHVVLTWAGSPAASAVLARLTDEGIAVADLADYRVAVGEDDPQGVVLGYGAASATQVDEALTALLTALRPDALISAG